MLGIRRRQLLPPVNDACSPAFSLGQNNFVLSYVDNQGGQAKTAVAVNDACPPVVSFGENPNSFNCVMLHQV